MSKPYLMPERKSLSDISRDEALAGVKRCKDQLKELEKKMLLRSNLRDAGVQTIKEQKKEHRNLSSQLKMYRTKLDNLGVKEP